MKSKKIICAFITALLAVSAVSCGNSDSEPSTEESKQSESVSESEASETSEEEESETETEAEEKTEAETSEKSKETADSPYGTTADITKYIRKTDKVTPPLWKVTDPETQNELYLMGTIHVLPNTFTEFPDYIMDIYENSDGVAVEYNVNEITSDIRMFAKYQQMFLYDDGEFITDHISDKTYQKAKAYFEKLGLYLEELDMFSAGYWYNQLGSIMLLRLENLSSEGVDSTFLSLAEDDGKEIVNIETIEIQAGAVDGYSDELVDYLIEEILDDIDDIDDYAESLAELYEYWATGNEDAMLEEEEDEVDDLPEDLRDDYEAYNKIMLYDRNEGMAEKASQYLKEGKNYFFMVGSAHYAGDRGVDDLLAEMGYTVEKIS